MTPALEFLMNTRKQKVEFDVEENFRNMGADTRATSGPMDFMRQSATAKGKQSASGFSSGFVDQDAVDA